MKLINRLFKLLLISIFVFYLSCNDTKKVHEEEDNTQHYYGESQDSVSIDSSNILIANHGTQMVYYAEFDSLLIMEGDIILPNVIKETKDKAANSLLGNIEVGKAWANKIIPYIIDKNVPDHIIKNIDTAIKHWEEKTPIRFKKRSNEEKYVIFSQASDPTIGSSNVGMPTRADINTIYLGSNTGLAVAIHEIGHTVGLWHEQSRPDRDQYVLIQYENIKRKNQFNFHIQGTAFGAYDYNSRMHYGAYAFSKNKKPTIVSKNPNKRIENNGFLSQGDIDAVNELYK